MEYYLLIGVDSFRERITSLIFLTEILRQLLSKRT